MVEAGHGKWVAFVAKRGTSPSRAAFSPRHADQYGNPRRPGSAFRKYGNMFSLLTSFRHGTGPPMKTTVDLPDELFRRAKAEAALRGRKLKDLVEEGLRLVLQTPRNERRPSLDQLMAPARGVVDSGVTDLASNPKHLQGFGRAARRNR